VSQALNGFYCAAPAGEDPSEDDIMRSCGRVIYMIDGAASGDGTLGSLMVRYNFLFSDPKITPEGSALAGQLNYASYTQGTTDTREYDSLVGKPALSPFTASAWRKRCLGACLLVLHYAVPTGEPGIRNLEIDGVNVPALDEWSVTGSPNDTFLSIWWLPYGRQVIKLVPTDPITNLKIDALATALPYAPGWI